MKTLSDDIYKLADTKLNNYGSGGMITKLEAANICMNSGCHMFIANGNKNNPIDQMIKQNFIQNLFQKYLLSLQEKNG